MSDNHDHSKTQKYPIVIPMNNYSVSSLVFTPGWYKKVNSSYVYYSIALTQNVSNLLFSQVHGVVNDTVDFVRGIISTEMNSATDNPVSFYLYVMHIAITCITVCYSKLMACRLGSFQV